MEEIYKPIEDLIFCQHDTHVKAIAALFLTHKISCVIVKKKHEPVGIVTKTDLLVSLIRPNLSTANQIMNSNLVYVELSDSVPEVSALMNNRKIHHVLVRSNGKFVGLVTSTDIVSHVIKKDQQENQSFLVELVEGKGKFGNQWSAVLQDEDFDIWLSKI
jgi:signal-transduction protein with cAMP-binding, CBS, and nucleotidyltransferase domain